MKRKYFVLNTFNNIIFEKVERFEVNFLVEISHNLSCSYLKHRYKNLEKVLMSEDVTTSELAIDAIAPLFERDAEGKFIKLEKAFNNWQPPIETEEQAAFFLNKLVAKSVEKYVSELLRNSDPFFSKILDSITYICTKQNINKKQILGTTYLVEDDKNLKIGSLPDSLFIDNLPSHYFYDLNKSISTIFEHILANTDNAAVIPLNALIMKIKRVRSADLNLPSISQPQLDFEVDGIVEKALSSTLIKLKDSYAKKGKLNETEVSGTEQVLRNIAFDLKDGGINTGLHKYFMEQFKEVAFDEYKNKYQNIIEYLFKVLKKEIADQLDDR